MRREIYQALKERLQEKVTDLKHIGLWNENMEDLPSGILFDTPAVFVEFAPITYTSAGQGTPRVPMEIGLHLVHKYTPEEPHESLELTDERRCLEDDPLAYLDLIEQVESAPIGLAGDGFSGLQLISSDLDHQHGELMHHWATFVTGVGYPSLVQGAQEHQRYRQTPRGVLLRE